MTTAHDPVRTAARTELDRLAHRWHSLPVGQAHAAAGPVRALASDLLGADLRDLGPAVALDQLRVAVFEAARGGTSDDALGERLAELRRCVTALLETQRP